MKVILKEDVANLGHLGDVREVTAGYARNFLVPRGLVIRATPRNMAEVAHERRLIDARIADRKGELAGLAERLGQSVLTFPVKVGEHGRLFGSVTAKQVAEALAAQGMPVDRRQVVMDGPLKAIGEETMKVDLGHGVVARVKVAVVPEEPAPEA
jgi:large subunit ribosomal protein L9